jgi:ferredoxin
MANNAPDDLRARAMLLIVSLALLGALWGRLAAPALSRTHYAVQAAERVWLEESQGLTDRTLQSKATRTQGIPAEKVYARAHAVQRRFRLGATLFGLWCGLAAALRIVRILSERRRREAVADRAHCLACGRCFLACPVEHQRIKDVAP